MFNHKIMQDNMSAHTLQLNGKVLSGKVTKHMHMRYFFIKNHVEAGEVKITDEIVGFYFTKPLQGKKFRNLNTAGT